VKDTAFFTKCEDQTIEVKCKVAVISVNNCKKCKINVGTVAGRVELSKCEKVVLSVDGICPIVEVSGCDQTTVVLERSTAIGDPNDKHDGRCQLLTTNSKTTNVQIKDAPDDPEEADYKEMAIPERFISKFNRATDMKEMQMETEVRVEA